MAATFEEVKDVLNHPEVYLIDVRNKDEIANTGSIPASLNIPFPELEAALKMPEEGFQSLYKREKPAKDAKIIFSCLKGGRAQRATKMALEEGFKNSKTYPGSWTEWSEKQAN